MSIADLQRLLETAALARHLKPARWFEAAAPACPASTTGRSQAEPFHASKPHTAHSRPRLSRPPPLQPSGRPHCTPARWVPVQGHGAAPHSECSQLSHQLGFCPSTMFTPLPVRLCQPGLSYNASTASYRTTNNGELRSTSSWSATCQL